MRSLVRSASIAGVALALVATAIAAQAPVEYQVRFWNAVHHEAEITVTFRDVPAGRLELRMSRTSPGRYALHEFAKNVYDVEITDARGRAVPFDRPNLHQWNVTDHRGTVRVRYTLFGDRGDGTYAQIDRTGALLNAPATYMWARQMRNRPVEVRFLPPRGVSWSVATQLEPGDTPLHFRAPDHQYLMDSPALLGDIAWRAWDVESGGRTQTIRFALRHQGSDQALDDYVEMVKAVVREQTAIYGELPEFDFGTYTFLAAYLPWVSGDGMEHRNSTVLTRVATLPEDALSVLGTVAHEFFHAWNVERIRPRSLEPFDFEAANMSDALWLAEGFTSYFDDLSMARGGLLDEEAFGRRVASMVNGVVLQPGYRHRSPDVMSQNAPFVDAAVSIDPQNRNNIFISYYTWGSAIALALDLTLRTEHATTLDEFMRIIWERYGKRFRPYSLQDVRFALEETTGNAAFAVRFFDRYMVGSGIPDFEALLAAAGYELAPARPLSATLRLQFARDDNGVRITSRPLEGTSAYAAGLELDDVLTSVAGEAVREASDVTRIFAARQPGDLLELEWLTRTGVERATVRLEADLTLAVTPMPGSHPVRSEWLRPLGG